MNSHPRVLHIGAYTDHGGGARAGLRLHQGLLMAGRSSRLLTLHPGKIPYLGASTMTGPRYARMRRIICKVSDTVITTRKFRHARHDFSSTIARYSPDWAALSSGTDIFHFHWLGDGLLSLHGIKAITKPVIWTLHDMWPMTGGCFHSGSCRGHTRHCGCCHFLRSDSPADHSHLAHKAKEDAYGSLSMSIVGPSSWMSERARESFLFGKCRIDTIPNPIESSVFAPDSRRFTKQMSSATTILFGAVAATSDDRKGYSLFREALAHLSLRHPETKFKVIVFGGKKMSDESFANILITHIGPIQSQSSLASLYSSADMFVSASRQENLPYTIMEALSCGTPCLAFDVGGISDLISHNKCGLLIPPYDTRLLADGIARISGDNGLADQMGGNARLRATQNWDTSVVVDRYCGLYDSLK